MKKKCSAIRLNLKTKDIQMYLERLDDEEKEIFTVTSTLKKLYASAQKMNYRIPEKKQLIC